MEGLKGSRLPKPSAIKRPQVTIKIPKQLSDNKIPLTAFRSLSRRRSKSVSDLRTIKRTPILQEINCIQNTKPTISKPAQKRKADKSSDEVKSKMVKHVKIPDWDYKARYNQLREKHTVLVAEHKEQLLKLEELEDIDTKYTHMKTQHHTLEKELSKKSADLLEQEKKNSEKIEKITNENNFLNSVYEDLKKNHLQVKDAYEKLLDSYNLLKNNHERKVAETENLSSNLDRETKRNVDLTNQNIQLKNDLLNSESLRRMLHNTIQDLKGNIRVFCRVRPPINLEEEERLQCMINYIDEKTIEIRKSRESISAISGKPTDIKAEFTLDKVFEPTSSQEQIFEDLSQLVQSAFDGYDICVFAYGQTGSGKTYTMQGGETTDQLGMIPRTVDLIFTTINNLSRAGWIYEVKASFLEVYNENVRDLLNPNTDQNLEIRYNDGKGITVTNLLIQAIHSAGELKDLIEKAQTYRAVAATDFNEHSSRSHAITKIYLSGINKEANLVYTGSINLVDLAGSESAKTSANERLVETKNINKSLSTLGSVMLALYNKDKHIPYRNSKLTYLLQSCLGGNSKTLMVVNIAPFEECYAETVNSLRFAAKVKEVKMCVKRNKTNFIPLPPSSGKV